MAQDTMAQMQIIKQPAIHEDELCDKFNGEAKESIRHSIETRKKTIYTLRKTAETFDSIQQGCSLSNRDANITGAFGGMFGMVAGGLTLASGGLAAPVLIASLTGIGAACSVGGGAWSIKNEYDRSKRNNETQQELLQQLAEDEEAHNQLNDILKRISRGDFGEPKKVFRYLHTFLAGLGGIGMVYGSTIAIDTLSAALPALAYFIPDETIIPLLSMLKYLPLITEKAALEGMDEVAEQSASSAVKFMHNGFSKNFVRQEALKAAQKEYEEVLEEAMEKAAKEAATKAAKEVGSSAAEKAAQEAVKEAAKKAAKDAATVAARKKAKKVAQERAKIAAKTTGAIAVGFGAFSVLWEGYNAYHNHYSSQEESQLGKELHRLADKMEKCLQKIYTPI